MKFLLNHVYRDVIFIYILILALTLTLQSQAQNNQALNGKIANQDTQTPLPAAVIQLKNYPQFGAVSDSTGAFALNIPTGIHDTLIISSLGYEQKQIPLSSIAINTDSIQIFLTPSPIMLKGITIESDRDEITKMVMEALARIKENYPNKRHQLKGIYRKVSTEDEEITHLQEAMITIQDGSYRKPPSNAKMKIDGFQETKDQGQLDSVWIDKMPPYLNGPYRLYETNLLHSYAKNKSYFSLKSLIQNLKHYRYELADVTVTENDTIYHIAMSESANPNLPPPKPHGLSYLKINASDLAIVEYQTTRIDRRHGENGLWHQYQVKFKKQSQKYYPVMMKLVKPRLINEAYFDGEYDHFTFHFDSVETGKFKKLKKREIIERTEKLSKNVQATNDWKQFPLSEDYPLENKVRYWLDSCNVDYHSE